MSCKLIHGIDLTQIHRDEFTNPNFIKRILTPQELSQYNQDIKYVAIRWAIKEAIFKALSLQNISYQQITIQKLNDQYIWIDKPNNIKQLVISTSQEKDVVIASVVAILLD